MIGDTGTGDRHQLADRQRAGVVAHALFRSTSSVMMGDNLYGGERPSDFEKKFAIPYKPLLDAGVKFYAALGNHDDAALQRNYKLFNMNGERFYSFKPQNGVRFFALDSNYVDKTAARLARQGAGGQRLGMEDHVLPSSALFIR